MELAQVRLPCIVLIAVWGTSPEVHTNIFVLTHFCSEFGWNFQSQSCIFIILWQYRVSFDIPKEMLEEENISQSWYHLTYQWVLLDTSSGKLTSLHLNILHISCWPANAPPCLILHTNILLTLSVPLRCLTNMPQFFTLHLQLITMEVAPEVRLVLWRRGQQYSCIWVLMNIYENLWVLIRTRILLLMIFAREWLHRKQSSIWLIMSNAD